MSISEVQNEILRQIGSNKLQAMTGVRIMIDGDNEVILNFGNKRTVISIIYDSGWDLYNLCVSKFGRTWKLKSKEKITGAYWDMLPEIIERETGYKVGLC